MVKIRTALEIIEDLAKDESLTLDERLIKLKSNLEEEQREEAKIIEKLDEVQVAINKTKSIAGRGLAHRTDWKALAKDGKIKKPSIWDLPVESNHAFNSNDVMTMILKLATKIDTRDDILMNSQTNGIDVKLQSLEQKLDKIISPPAVQKYTCGLCGNSTDQIIRHHYSYFPEKIIYVCPRCNIRDNLEREHPLLNPSKEDANKFYGRDVSNGEPDESEDGGIPNQ